MKRYGNGIALLFLGGLTAARADAVDDYIRGEMEQRRIPGVALQVIRNGQPVKTGMYGFANLEWKLPVTPETVFEIGSLTKTFTSAGILLLAQEGRLSVDDRLAKHLPEIPAAWTNVTLRHLLTHTSGIKSYTGLDGFELTGRQTRAQFIARLTPQPTEFEPGEKYKYSNSGYNLLGHVIESVSGTNYWAFMTRRIFRPLGMTATTDRDPRNIIPNRASGYERTNRVHINRDYDVTDVFAAGAIVSTIGDLARWNAALDSDELLSAQSKSLMWTPGRLNDGTPITYGLGWRIETVEGRRKVGHSGSTSGFSASLQRHPDRKLAVIVLTNTDEQIATRLADRIASLCEELKQ
jgi:CubicO group peptidase (beta-lactamase class C family)